MRLLTTLFLSTALWTGAHAAEGLKAGIVGTWKLVSIYDQFTDGTRRETWGADPQGQIIFTPEGTFSAVLVAGDRAPKPGTVPTDPVGPSIAYYGSYSIDEATKKITRQLVQSTFPQWKGAAQTVIIDSLSDTELKVVAMPIKDPKGGEFVPHLELVRVK